MIQLDLNPAEKEILAGALDDYLSDLRMEIADTDSHDFKEGLKERKQVIVKVLEKIRAS